jgi:hypothetical protein
MIEDDVSGVCSTRNGEAEGYNFNRKNSEMMQ